MNTCSNCGKVAGLHSSILQGCMCQYSMQAPPKPEQEPMEWHEIVLNQKQFLDKMELLLAKTTAPPQPEQEPVAQYIGEGYEGSLVQLYDDVKKGTNFYTTPPQRTWVKLTDEEYWQIATDCTIGGDLHADKFARAIEAKLKEKNT